jgi:transcriptional regulator with GAF, ATPase, and Fis domain
VTECLVGKEGLRLFAGAPSAESWKVAGPKGAAAFLCMHRSTMQSRMQKLGISFHA